MDRPAIRLAAVLFLAAAMVAACSGATSDDESTRADTDDAQVADVEAVEAEVAARQAERAAELQFEADVLAEQVELKVTELARARADAEALAEVAAIRRAEATALREELASVIAGGGSDEEIAELEAAIDAAEAAASAAEQAAESADELAERHKRELDQLKVEEQAARDRARRAAAEAEQAVAKEPAGAGGSDESSGGVQNGQSGGGSDDDCDDDDDQSSDDGENDENDDGDDGEDDCGSSLDHGRRPTEVTGRFCGGGFPVPGTGPGEIPVDLYAETGFGLDGFGVLCGGGSGNPWGDEIEEFLARLEGAVLVEVEPATDDQLYLIPTARLDDVRAQLERRGLDIAYEREFRRSDDRQLVGQLIDKVPEIALPALNDRGFNAARELLVDLPLEHLLLVDHRFIGEIGVDVFSGKLSRAALPPARPASIRAIPSEAFDRAGIGSMPGQGSSTVGSLNNVQLTAIELFTSSGGGSPGEPSGVGPALPTSTTATTRPTTSTLTTRTTASTKPVSTSTATTTSRPTTTSSTSTSSTTPTTTPTTAMSTTSISTASISTTSTTRPSTTSGPGGSGG